MSSPLPPQVSAPAPVAPEKPGGFFQNLVDVSSPPARRSPASSGSRRSWCPSSCDRPRPRLHRLLDPEGRRPRVHARPDRGGAVGRPDPGRAEGGRSSSSRRPASRSGAGSTSRCSRPLMSWSWPASSSSSSASSTRGVTFKQSLAIALDLLRGRSPHHAAALVVMALKGDWNVTPRTRSRRTPGCSSTRATAAKPLWAFLSSLDLFSIWTCSCSRWASAVASRNRRLGASGAWGASGRCSSWARSAGPRSSGRRPSRLCPALPAAPARYTSSPPSALSSAG